MKQLNLFDSNNSSLTPRQKSIIMDREALIKWKQRIFKYQETIKNSQPQQQTLFELKIHNCLFWRMPEPLCQFSLAHQ